MITKIILENILICNLTNNKFQEKLKNAFRVGNGNCENSKLFEGLVILNKKEGKTNDTTTHITHRISLDRLFSSLYLVSSLFYFSRLVLSLLFRLPFSLSLSSLSVSHCIVAVESCCVLCLVSCVVVCVVCGVWCDTLEEPPCARSKRPVCTGTTRIHVSTCARGAGTHGDVVDGHTGRLREGGRKRFYNISQNAQTKHRTS